MFPFSQYLSNVFIFHFRMTLFTFYVIETSPAPPAITTAQVTPFFNSTWCPKIQESMRVDLHIRSSIYSHLRFTRFLSRCIMFALAIHLSDSRGQ